MEKEWFETWFDTEAYHQLYKNRDLEEASFFINNLLNYLSPQEGSKFIDIACGKGRHAKQIHDKGFVVDGFDLSENSIQHAKELEKQGLNFYTHDMRKLFRINYYDFAFNLFTSFGYFQTERDEQLAMSANIKNLKLGGKLVVDFLNREKVIDSLVPEETKFIDGVEFNILKTIENNQVVKKIEFEQDGKIQKYEERVKLLGVNDFEKYASKENRSILQVFGDYGLGEFDAKNSDRLIIIIG